MNSEEYLHYSFVFLPHRISFRKASTPKFELITSATISSANYPLVYFSAT